jgi:homoserine dehydrogenase
LDVRYARELGRRIRLLAVAKRTDDGLELKVAPTLIPETSPLAKVTNAFNAVQIIGDSVGELFYQGWGAGRRPTASAVCSDVIDAALGRTPITFNSLNLWSDQREGTPLKDAKKIEGRAYLRLEIDDRPGVMAAISDALGRRGVSIASMIQHASADAENPRVPLIILTHSAPTDALEDAIAEIDASPFAHGKTTRLALLD